jgi:predicted dehydrogenase
MKADMLNVLVIGCGNIGGGFDLDYQGDMPPCTHAGVFDADPRFTLLACVDPDSQKCQAFQKKWAIPHLFSTVDEVLSAKVKVDVISICSPTVFHHSNIVALRALKPSLIFCEKPVASSVADTKALIALCQKENILLAVNYNRRWDEHIVHLQQAIKNNHYGALRSVVGLYNKGILNNGSHLLDLLDYLLGKVSVQTVLPGVNDFFKQDPSVSALLLTDTGIPVHLVTGHAEDYAIFELQFIFSKGLLAMQDGGLVWLERKSTASERFRDYTVLDKGIHYEGGLSRAMMNAADNIYYAITEDRPLASDGHSALRTQILCEAITTLATHSNKHGQ